MAYIEIDKSNYIYNLNQLALKTGSKDKIAVVLKDNAYGHGLEIMAKIASEFGIENAVVIDKKEAYAIERYFKNILILNDTPTQKSNFSYAVSSIDKLQSCNKKAKIELKIDTGMHRNGIMIEELSQAIDIIKRRKINLYGVMTHYSKADELGSEYFYQKRLFDEIRSYFSHLGFKGVRFHSHNSSALIRCNSFDEDIARVGIASYGYNCLPKIFGEFELKPVISLWAKKISTRRLKKGQRVGYGGDFIAPKDMIISTYDIGYGDGWPRGDSKNPYILPNGLEIIGRVSMDFISLETTKERVCIMNNAKLASRHFNTISYEMTTSLKESLKRVVV